MPFSLIRLFCIGEKMYNRNCTVDGGDGENKQPKAKEKGNAHIKCVGVILSLVLGKSYTLFFLPSFDFCT